ncbi:MAG: hypothetical protein KC561_13925, partial [Myxococcales bacterium]|nr:hypothetical protein [Myxococcales bacterium]
MRFKHTFQFIVIALGIWASRPALAQFPDLVEVSAQYLPAVELRDIEGGNAQVSSYDGSINIPLVLGETTFLIPGLSYHADSIAFDGVPEELNRLRLFHSVSLPLLFVQLLPEDWAFSARIAPTLAGDFAAIDSQTYQMSALAMATRPFSARVVFGFGAIVSFSFGELLPLPALYLDWTPTPWFRFESFLPALAQASFIVGDRLVVGPRFDISGNEYAVRDAAITNCSA